MRPILVGVESDVHWGYGNFTHGHVTYKRTPLKGEAVDVSANNPVLPVFARCCFLSRKLLQFKCVIFWKGN